MDWDKLKFFIQSLNLEVLPKHLQFSILSQSAISRQIQSLENELKIHLFERHARGLCSY